MTHYWYVRIAGLDNAGLHDAGLHDTGLGIIAGLDKAW